ncbi:MAG: aminodeoxychorismate/anthranilate synthase component II [Desulfobacteraceae bacterium]|nr:MAG: aminodeoxychorismate/anthranilate synthase component II [Desulfobacteraceae bacterium]
MIVRDCIQHKLVVIDNYDSFTFNLVQMFMQYSLNIEVFRSDQIRLPEIEALHPDYILISPGPKNPAFAGISMPLIQSFFQHTPILGVCLGMQCMGEVFGGKTVRAPLPIHGKTSKIMHCSRYIFQGIPSPFSVARYHSLMTRLDNPVLEITATSDDGVIMGLSHPEYPLHGVQFHPESFLTEHGFTLIENFLKLGPMTDPKRKLIIHHESFSKNQH